MVRTAASTSVRVGLWVSGSDARRSSICTFGVIGMPFYGRRRTTLGSHVEAHWMIREQKGSQVHTDNAEPRRPHARNTSRQTEGHLSTQDRPAFPTARGRGAAWPDGLERMPNSIAASSTFIPSTTP